jgi:hypothetical protein
MDLESGGGKTMSTFSIFEDCTSTRAEDIKTGLPADASKHKVQIEFVYRDGADPEEDTPIAIFIIHNGERVAQHSQCRWISLSPDVVMQGEPPPIMPSGDVIQ